MPGIGVSCHTVHRDKQGINGRLADYAARCAVGRLQHRSIRSHIGRDASQTECHRFQQSVRHALRTRWKHEDVEAGKKNIGLRGASEELDTFVRRPRARRSYAHGLSIRPAIDRRTGVSGANFMKPSTSKSVPLTGFTVPSVPNRSTPGSCADWWRTATGHRHAVRNDFEQPGCRPLGQLDEACDFR